jgi:hypothetical protein
VFTAAIAAVIADESGSSKAEVVRRWLPFGVWLTLGTVLPPSATRRRWLAGQAATALVIAHLVLTKW